MADFLYSPIKTAHRYWKEIVEPSDTVIDATLGNGKDALFLAPLCKTLIGIDIQQAAIASSKTILPFDNIQFILGSHAEFPGFIVPGSVKLIVYNLGYLPRGDKSVVTKTETTLQSLKNAQDLVMPGGMISITCYSGHEEGAKEEAAVLAFASSLNPEEWCTSQHRWLNRSRCPSLVLLAKGTRSPSCNIK